VYFDEFLRSAEARFEYWRQKVTSHRDFADAQPNVGHRTLAQWEQAGRLRGVITQNIDGLHQIAGSGSVLELHGTARWVACLQCSQRFDAGEMVERFRVAGNPPTCTACSGLLKHATISFGQSLPTEVLEAAIQWSVAADLFLTMGSSLVVQPAASLPMIAKEHGARVVIINRDPTPLDHLADVVIRSSIGEVVSTIDACLETGCHRED
jgi:NAD-dependent deacetylase